TAAAALVAGGALLAPHWAATLGGGSSPSQTPAGGATPATTGPGTEPTSGSSGVPTGDPTTGPTTGDPTTGDPATPGATTRPMPPDGWRSHTSAAGRFSIAVPPGWRAVKSATRDSVTVRGPGTPGALIVEWTVAERPWTDPVRHWEALEKEILDRGEFTAYRRIAIDPITYLGRPAADWEFTRQRGGTVIHVINRGFRTADGRPYALYWETSHDRWRIDRHYFDTFARTFSPR
ncbi:hypothetical protein, partial [Nonomuraea lactucae]|uniref:hypothetical protein n=1 Tax=Nonomuraea lactucae TaxID=2249762 RepID=UPI003B834B23